jgi:hypothetical protein
LLAFLCFSVVIIVMSLFSFLFCLFHTYFTVFSLTIISNTFTTYTFPLIHVLLLLFSFPHSPFFFIT